MNVSMVFWAFLPLVCASTLMKLEGRILNGDEAAPNQFPFQVRLTSVQATNLVICGGSIITQTYVLTAAHCTTE